MWKNLSIEMNGLARALLISLLLAVLTATSVYYTGLAETLFSSLNKLILIISVFIGACYVSKLRGSRGLIRGLSFGLMFFVLMLILTLVFDPSLINIKSFLYAMALCLISGALGGILGIGLSNNWQ